MDNQETKTVEINQAEVISNKPKKKKKVGKIVFNIITTILFIVILLEAVVGIVNMNRISNDQKPVWYLNKKVTESELKTETEYNLGLYKIVKTDTSKKTTVTLKPFFIGD